MIVRIMRRFILASIFFLSMGRLGATPKAADIALSRLLELWRWQRYWYESSDADSFYRPGTRTEIRLFWIESGTKGGIGLCVRELRRCQFYPDVERGWLRTEKRLAGDSAKLRGEEQFIREALEEFPLKDVEKVHDEVRTLAFPDWEPPLAIRNREMRPAAELSSLVERIGCSTKTRGCQITILVPFYADSDPSVFIYRECRAGCGDRNTAVLLVRLVDEKWVIGATNVILSESRVRRARKQIERAIMWRID